MSDLALLTGTRVLDFGTPALAYAGRVFVELGAEVVLVEPPGGLAMRWAPPLVEVGHDRLGTTFLAYAAGKRSVTLDESSDTGRALRDRLVASADVVLAPGTWEEMRDRGLDEATLRSLDVRLVVTAATAFGLDGPRRSWRGSETTAWASSGMSFVMGDPDRPPAVPPVGLTDAVTSLNAAMGTLLAMRARTRTGRGQLVDISMQEAALSVSMEAGPQMALEGRTPGRVPRSRLPGVGIHPVADGAIDVNAFLPTQWDALAAWITEDLGIEEAGLDALRGPVSARMPFHEMIDAWLVELGGRYTKQAFFLEAQRRGIPCGAVNDVADLGDDPQLAATDGWVDHPFAGAPGLRLPRGPLTVDGDRPGGGRIPEVGEADGEILGPLADG